MVEPIEQMGSGVERPTRSAVPKVDSIDAAKFKEAPFSLPHWERVHPLPRLGAQADMDAGVIGGGGDGRERKSAGVIVDEFRAREIGFGLPLGHKGAFSLK